MISYAQNFEDVMLHRVFRDKKNGFYIDIGAMDPVIESVTKFFYDEGWCGINIEPNEWFFNKLAAERERDINLNIAVGDREESRTFYASNETGLSTFDEQSRDLFLARGFKAEEKAVSVTTLAAICSEHVDRPIDFLKVDCEGWEKRALAGADWDRFRPTVVVVEATLPGTPVPAWAEWETILIENAHYDMVYYDGLNRFYLRRDSPGLKSHFSVPPNVFDEFKVHATELAERANERLAGRVMELRQELDSTVGEFKRELRNTVAEAEQSGKEWKMERGQLAGRVAELELRVAHDTGRIAELEQERSDLGQVLLKTRLWVGQLSQDLVASKLHL